MHKRTLGDMYTCLLDAYNATNTDRCESYGKRIGIKVQADAGK